MSIRGTTPISAYLVLAPGMDGEAQTYVVHGREVAELIAGEYGRAYLLETTLAQLVDGGATLVPLEVRRGQG